MANIIDGRTGNLISGSLFNASSSTYGQQQQTQQVNYTTTQPATIQQTTYVQQQPAIYSSGYNTTTGATGYGQNAGYTTNQVVGYTTGQTGYASTFIQPTTTTTTTNINRVGGGVTTSGTVVSSQVIKGQSRIEYIPFEQKITDYETREWIERVPKQRKIIEYEQKRWIENVPREVTAVDYYAIQYLRQYIPQVIPEKYIQTVPVQRIVQRTEYIPVQRKIVHYPEVPLAVEYQNKINQGISIGNVGRVVSSGVVTTSNVRQSGVVQNQVISSPVITSTVQQQPVVSTTFVQQQPVVSTTYVQQQPVVTANTYATNSKVGGYQTNLVGVPTTQTTTYNANYIVPATTTYQTTEVVSSGYGNEYEQITQKYGNNYDYNTEQITETTKYQYY